MEIKCENSIPYAVIKNNNVSLIYYIKDKKLNIEEIKKLLKKKI